MKHHHKKLYLISALLLSTSLSTAANAACPSPVSGAITVSGASTGCILTNGDSLNVTAGGNIVGLSENGVLVDLDAAGNIINSGNIDGDIDGIRVTNSTIIGEIRNEVGGSITGESTGIYVVDSTLNSIFNDGYITSNTWLGIHISNSTVIESITNGVNGHLEPLAYGSGILVSDGSYVQGNIVNDGHIAGRNLTSAPNAGIEVIDSVIVSNIINNGTIEMNSLAGYDNVRGISVSGSSAYVGSIINDTDGIINTRLSAIYVDGATLDRGIVNRGSLTAIESYSAINLKDMTISSGGISNEVGATVTSHDYYALAISDSMIIGDFNNGGSLTGTDSGRGIWMADSTLDGEFINEGSIDGGEGGVAIYNSTLINGISNEGHISSADGDGLYISGSDIRGDVYNNGYIGGGNYSIYTYGLTRALTIFNYGELDGAVYINDTTLNLEDGTIMASSVDGDAIVNINTDFSTSANYGQSAQLDKINISNGNKFSALGSNSFSAQEFNNFGTFSILQGHTVNVAGNYYQDSDGTLRIQANSISNYGKLSVAGDAIFELSSLFVDVTNGANFANNAVLSSVVSATGTLDVTDLSISDNSTLFDFSTQVVGHDMNLIVASSSSSSVEQSVNNENNNPSKGAAKVLDQIIAGSPTGDMAAIRDALGTLTSEGDVSKAVSQTLPTLTGGATSAMMQTMSTTSQVVQARQDQNTGFSSGDDFIVNQSAWIKAFGSWANQGNKNGVVGFGADTYGMVAGADRVLDDAWRLGAAFTYANTNVDSDDKLNKLDVDTYLATVYSSYTVDPQTEANFQVSLGYNNNDSSRIINFGGLNRVAKGEFDSYSFNAGAGIGRRYDIDAATSFVPSVRFDYNLMSNESYQESGAGALNLNLKSQTTDQLIPAIQAKVSHDAGHTIVVSGNAGVGYDLLNGANSVTSSYVGGGSAFSTTGLRASPWIIRAGLGATYKPSDAYDITVRYDREDRGSEFDNQSVTAKLRMPF